MQAAEQAPQVVVQNPRLLSKLRKDFGDYILAEQVTCDGIPTLWIDRQHLLTLLETLKTSTSPIFEMLFDITAIDERLRVHREGQPASEFTVVYHLMSFSGNCDFRVKVPLEDSDCLLYTSPSPRD